MIELGDWRIRRYDRLNLTVEHRHAGRANNGKGAGVVKFRPTGSYFQTVEGAVSFIRRMEALAIVSDEDTVMGASEFLEALKSLDESIRKAVSESFANATQPDNDN